MTAAVARARQLATRAVRAGSAVAQRIPDGRWNDLACKVPGLVGAHASFIRTKARLTAGQYPNDVDRVIRRLLRHADACHRARSITAATELFDMALQLAYHPTVHHRPVGSPLALDAEKFLAPFRESTFAQRMQCTPDPREESNAGGRRVLAVAHGSWTFLDRVIDAFHDSTSVTIKKFDLTTLPAADRPSHRAAVRARAHYLATGAKLPAPAALREQLRGIDTVFVEWGTYTFAWLTLLDLPDTRIVARLHRYEAFTPYPSLACFAAVDDMLFISPSVRELVRAGAPRLSQAARVSTVRNPHDYTPFTTEKNAGADRTLVQVGWAIPVKDAIFTLDVLEQLREEDPRWRLLLVGPEPPTQPENRDRAFVTELKERVSRAGAAVEVLGRRNDVPEVLRRAGFVMSSSRHEGTHESVAEGAAAGCVPVVRNWPEAAPWAHGAASIYPRQWIVESVQEAVDRIHLAEGSREELGLDAAQWVETNLPANCVLPPYTAAITGDYSGL